MKSILVIGIGRFGKHLCMDLVKNGNDVMAVDEREENLEDILSLVTSAKIADCTREEVLKSFGVANFDICFVCIGTNFQSSLEITSQLKELGAPYVISKATRDIQAKFLLRNGADEVVYPERDITERIAKKSSASHVFDFVDLGDYGIYEVLPLKNWVGKSIKELNVRVSYNISILGIREKDGSLFMPDADYRFEGDDHMMVMGSDADLARFIKKL